MDPRERLSALLEEKPFDLVEAALLLGCLEGVEVQVAPYREMLRQMASEARSRVGDGGIEAVKALNRYLFEELGFRGNEEDYYDPKNSFLGSVLDRKVGLPITLSLVYVEVAQRAGLPVKGVGFPGHFILRFEDENGPIFLDPFHGGQVLEEEDLRAMLEEMGGTPVSLDPSLLQPASNREIFTRMLYNLKGVYLTAEDFDRLLQVLDILLLMNPRSPLDLRDRGLVHYELGHFRPAQDDLRAYLELDPTAGDAEVIRAHLDDIESRLRMFR